MSDFLAFRLLVTPRGVRVLYITGVAFLTTAGIALISGCSGGSTLIGLAVIILGNLAWRVTCECAVALFDIHGAVVGCQPQRSEKALPTESTDEMRSSGWVCAECGEPLAHMDKACPKCRSHGRRWAGRPRAETAGMTPG